MPDETVIQIEMYGLLDLLLRTCVREGRVPVFGSDFNACIGLAEGHDPVALIGVCGVGEHNERGNMFMQFVLEHGLQIGRYACPKFMTNKFWMEHWCKYFFSCWDPVCTDASLEWFLLANWSGQSLGALQSEVQQQLFATKACYGYIERVETSPQPFANNQVNIMDFFAVTAQGSQASRLTIWKVLCYMQICEVSWFRHIYYLSGYFAISAFPRVAIIQASTQDPERRKVCKFVNFRNVKPNPGNQNDYGWSLDACFTANRCGQWMRNLLAVGLLSNHRQMMSQLCCKNCSMGSLRHSNNLHTLSVDHRIDKYEV